MNTTFLVGLSVPAIILASAAATMGQEASRTPSGPVFVLWHEAEDYATARQDGEKVLDARLPASGGKILYSQTMNHKGDVVTFKLDLPQDIAQARIIFRYARLHWRDSMTPAIFEVTVAGRGKSSKRKVSFDNTGGWGRKAGDYGLASADFGPLKRGPLTLKMTTLKDGDINLDGFFISDGSFKVTDKELSRLVLLQIASDGYCGLLSNSTVLRQGGDNRLAVAARSFAERVGKIDATLKSGDKTIALKPVAERASGAVRQFALPQVPDGQYALKLASTEPKCEVAVQVILAGQLMASLEDDIGALETFTRTLAGSRKPNAVRCLADMQHMVEYLKVGEKKLTQSTADAASAWKEGLAEHEGLTKAEPVAAIRQALAQAKETMRRLKAGQDPYQGRIGDIRRAYHSTADEGAAVPYRVFVPDSYTKAEKVPFIYMLHGGGGDENYWPEMQGGVLLEMLNKAGYLAVMPKWHSRRSPKGNIKQLLELVLKEYPKIDRDRVYCTGISMGGFGTYSLATAHPEYFAAVCCVSGTGNVAKAERLKSVPLLILQGGSDGVVPPAGAKKVAARMKELGQTVELHIFPTYGHAYYPKEYLPLTLKFFGRFTRGAK